MWRTNSRVGLTRSRGDQVSKRLAEVDENEEEKGDKALVLRGKRNSGKLSPNQE